MKLGVQSGYVPQVGKHVAVVTLEENPVIPTHRHHLLVLDCSGSMSPYIKNIREDSQQFVSELSESDFVSVIIFSGHGRAQLVVGLTACNVIGRDMVGRAIQREVRVMDTTVFSEPLEMVLATAKRLAGSDISHNAILFTDGCAVPTRWNEREEERRSCVVAEALYAQYTALNVLGYGMYYNPKFIGELMRSAGNSGIYRHISEIVDFGEAVREIREVVEKTSPISFEIGVQPETANAGRVFKTTPELVLGGQGGKLSSIGLYEGKVTLFVELDGPSRIFYIGGKVNGVPIIRYHDEASALSDENAAAYVRVLAGYSFLTGDKGGAAELLELLGDEGLQEKAAYAYSEREQRETGDTFRRMFVNGHIGAGLRPTGPNHCVATAMRELIADPDNIVYMPPGSYKRSGLKTVDRSVMQDPRGGMVKILGYSSHESRLNFSVRGLKEIAVVEDGRRVVKKQWRTYNIILDGNLRTSTLLASISESSFSKLQEAGVIAEHETYDATKVYRIDFSNMKLTSPAWARPKALGLVHLMMEEVDLKAEQWALNQLFREAARAEDDEDLHRPDEQEIDTSAVVEYYTAPCVEYRLMGYKPGKSREDYLSYWLEESKKPGFGNRGAMRLKEVRHRLIAVRYNMRMIIFSMEKVGSNVIRWDAGKETKRGQWPKLEQTGELDGATLKRVTWQEQVACS